MRKFVSFLALAVVLIPLVSFAQKHPITVEDMWMEPTVYMPAAQTSDGFVMLVHAWFSPQWVIRTRDR